MGTFPDRPRLYRNWRQTVTSALLVLICGGMLGELMAQIARRRPVDKGPRALGLIELASNGRARLVPITIMLEGRFYDAEAYKADPVPMALQPETVYEALRTGVPQGLFTVGGAEHAGNAWVAEGTWVSQEQIAAEKARSQAEKRVEKSPAPDQEIGGPPKLKRGPESTPQNSSRPEAPKANTGTSGDGTKASPAEPSASASAPVEDANRPILRRQPLSASPHEQTKASPETAPLKGSLQLIPAVSDADGPEARPYIYRMQPEEEQALLKKMLRMAGEEVRSRAAQVRPRAAAAKSKTIIQPSFHDVNFHVFDLSTSNEGVPVLTATAKLPSSEADDLEFIVALVAHQDVYGELHKVFAQTTDNKHLDAVPRYDLIDAVDADGDGRGELLFRESWDRGTAFVVYRVIGDQVWPLYQGRPSS
jgi:hypothetical protein